MLLGPIMNLVNGPTINSAIVDPGNAIAKLVRENKDDAAVVRELFMRILNRPPTDGEIAQCVPSMQLSTFQPEHDALVAKVTAHEKQVDARQAVWEEQYRKIGEPSWTPVEFVKGASKAGATFQKQEDQSVKVGGKLAKDTHSLTFQTDLKGITGIRVEALPDDSLPEKGPGRAKNGNFVLSELKLAVESTDDAKQKQDVPLQNASADFSQDSWDVGGAIDGNPVSGWAVSPQFGKPHLALFETKEDAGYDGGTKLQLSMQYDFPDGQHQLGRFRISVTNSPRPIRLDGSGLPAEIEKLIHLAADQRTPEQIAKLRDYHRSLDGRLKELNADVDGHARLGDDRLMGAQDIAWALINSPAFLFNR